MQYQSTVFSQRVWELAISIPIGRVTTYGILAQKAGGSLRAAQSITAILARAPNQRAIPYHRIVYSSGKIWTSHTIAKKRLLQYRAEKILITPDGKISNFDQILWDYTQENADF